MTKQTSTNRIGLNEAFRRRLELLPGAEAQYKGQWVNYVKALRKDYGFFGLKQAGDYARHGRKRIPMYFSQPLYQGVAPQITDSEITKLFAAFNKQGILAKYNHLCCSNCASTDLCDKAAKSDSYIGIAYNHQQDVDSFATDPTKLVIRYCQTDDDKYRAEHVGMIITFIARQQGFTVDWNGDASKVIYLRKC